MDVLADAPRVSTTFALLADLEELLPRASWDVRGVPGVLLGADGDFPSTSDDVFLDGILHGSSPTPVGYFALALGGHSFYVMFNPLDPSVRRALEQQSEASWLCVAVVARDMQVVRTVTRVPVHSVALRDTANRAPVSTKEWLRTAEKSAAMLPTLCAMGAPALAKSATHHAYFLVSTQAEILEHINTGGRA